MKGLYTVKRPNIRPVKSFAFPPEKKKDKKKKKKSPAPVLVDKVDL